MKRAMIAITVLAGAALTGCAQTQCTPGGVCVVTPRQSAQAAPEASGPWPPPVVAPSPSKRKVGRPTKTPRTPNPYKTVTFLMRQRSSTSVFIYHRIEGRKRATELPGYTERGYRSEPHTLVVTGSVALMEVRADTEEMPSGLECWILISNRVAARSSAVDGVCSVRTIVG